MIRSRSAPGRLAWIFACFIGCMVARAAVAEDALPTPIAVALQRAAIPAGAASFYVQQVGAFNRREARDQARGEASATSGESVALARFASRGEFRPLLSVRSDQPMNPASTMKLRRPGNAIE